MTSLKRKDIIFYSSLIKPASDNKRNTVRSIKTSVIAHPFILCMRLISLFLTPIILNPFLRQQAFHTRSE